MPHRVLHMEKKERQEEKPQGEINQTQNTFANALLNFSLVKLTMYTGSHQSVVSRRHVDPSAYCLGLVRLWIGEGVHLPVAGRTEHTSRAERTGCGAIIVS